MLREKQIGHTGTLDPAAGGLLVLCLGPYTKLVPYLTQSDKTYRGYFGLGIQTATDDREGEVLSAASSAGLTLERLQTAARAYVGEIQQIPPSYAAIKVQGKKLYEYARKGQEVQVEPRNVTVHSFEIVSLEPAGIPEVLAARATASGIALPADGQMMRVEFATRVSAGTYVRALARDLGRDVATGGYLDSLWRGDVGQFSDQQALPLEKLQQDPESAWDYLVNGAAALDQSKYPVFRIVTAFAAKLKTGQPLTNLMMEDPQLAGGVASGAICGIASDDGGLLAMVEAERFEATARTNVYGTKVNVRFKPVRIFPGGLR